MCLLQPLKPAKIVLQYYWDYLLCSISIQSPLKVSGHFPRPDGVSLHAQSALRHLLQFQTLHHHLHDKVNCEKQSDDEGKYGLVKLKTVIPWRHGSSATVMTYSFKIVKICIDRLFLQCKNSLINIIRHWTVVSPPCALNFCNCLGSLEIGGKCMRHSIVGFLLTIWPLYEDGIATISLIAAHWECWWCTGPGTPTTATTATRWCTMTRPGSASPSASPFSSCCCQSACSTAAWSCRASVPTRGRGGRAGRQREGRRDSTETGALHPSTKRVSTTPVSSFALLTICFSFLKYAVEQNLMKWVLSSFYFPLHSG